MGKYKPISVGDKFGRWMVTGPAPKRGGRKDSRWFCRCDCGVQRDVLGFHLNSGATVSCGRHGGTHNMEGTPEYKAYYSMLGRCYNPKGVHYRDYGGRGITVCERWRESFENFYADMGKRPSSLRSLDRIDNADGYSPDNCCWATRTEQARNRRSNRLLTFQGETLTSAEWAARLDLDPNTIHMRLKRGLSTSEVLAK